MSKLESRLAVLERQLPQSDPVTLLHITFLSGRDRPGPSVTGVTEMLGDWSLAREPGEELPVFYARAEAAVPQGRSGMFVMMDQVADNASLESERA